MFSTKLTIITVALAVGSVLGASLLQLDNGLQYIIDYGMAYNALRVAILVLLMTLLFVRPPRPVAMRLFLGAAGVMLHVGALYLLFSYSLSMLDAFVFMAVAVVFAVEALEPETAPQPSRQMAFTTSRRSAS